MGNTCYVSVCGQNFGSMTTTARQTENIAPYVSLNCKDKNMKHQKLGNRIYYYCKLSTAIEDILPDFRLLLSPIQKTNDPRESSRFVFDHTRKSGTDIGDTYLLDIQYSKIIRSGCKVICFSQDSEVYWGSLLSKMWAHYGDNHKGICLEIDKEKFIQENSDKYDFKLFKDIFYFEYDPFDTIEHKLIDHNKINGLGLENYLKNDFRKEHLDYLFYTKNSEWSSEVEKRLLHFSEKSENEYCSIKNSLTNIILGLNFHKSYLPSIKNLIGDNDVDIVETTYGDIGFNFKP